MNIRTFIFGLMAKQKERKNVNTCTSIKPKISGRLFVDVLDEWLKYHSNEVADSTAYRYETQCRFLKEYFSDTLLEDIGIVQINNFVIDMKREGFTDSVIVNYCKVLSLCFKYAITVGYISDNPVDNACIPKIPRHTEIYPYSIEEVMKLLDLDYSQWVKDGIMIAFHTGMRMGEIYALKWSDINFEKQFIMVQRAQSRAGSKISIKTTKTASGIRRIDIDKYLTAYLKKMKSHSTSVYLFSPNNTNCIYDFRVPWNLSGQVKKMCMMAGIPPRNFHAFRHTHATVLLAYGVHPKIVQERLGHSDIGITMETYSHVLPTIQKEAVKVFEGIGNKYYDNERVAAVVFDNIIELSQYTYYGTAEPIVINM